MSQPDRTSHSNRVLQSLGPTELGLLEPHLSLVTLALGEVLVRAHTPIRQILFIERGIVSLIALAADGEQIEIGLVGWEGFIGLPVLLGAESTPTEARVQMAGLAFAISTEAILEAFQKNFELRRSLLRYVHAQSTQIEYTALANGRYKTAQRLARWLLMCHDRVEGDELPTTHQFLSLMLGINRPGLTTALADLERSGVIINRRGNITICNRSSLLTMAGATYGQPEQEYSKMIR